MKRAVFARIVARHNRDMAVTLASITEGVWNPNYLAADATQEAKLLMQDLRYLIERIEAAISPATETVSIPTHTGG